MSKQRTACCESLNARQRATVSEPTRHRVPHHAGACASGFHTWLAANWMAALVSKRSGQVRRFESDSIGAANTARLKHRQGKRGTSICCTKRNLHSRHRAESGYSTPARVGASGGLNRCAGLP
ncbi:hypothetical protein N658DRAFT_109685 [Parathielavia hyrcaniae]|uniref:Uncharacterized protein n=1 Tax=Parathielavia hyrcaniae TaxID=113614 RepID=A0AAN6Q7U7_9PEZI|nr:hypothetical protein N658DRAFT_109685 [Parathielavia hyrcaniae]